MSAIDIGIVVFALAMAAIGFERGLVGSALPLAGFVAGVAVGARVGPALLSDGSESAYAPAVAAIGGVLVGLFLAVALDGLGSRLSERLRSDPLRRSADGVGGALLLAALALGVAWVFGAVALNAPGDTGDLRRSVQRSTVLASLNDVLPPSGPLLNTLRRIDPTPSVRGPEADVASPDRRLADDEEVRAASSSVVRVLGTACGLGVAGSGWVAGPGLVVTNAHVVAGADDTTVTAPGAGELEAVAVHYEPRNDLAVLRVDGIGAGPLELVGQPRRGTSGATAGYPGNGPLTLTPARLGRTGTVISRDSYGRGPLERSMTPFRGPVRGGNSGGPVLDGEGRVLTTVFASELGSDGPPSGLGVPNRIVAAALDGPLRPTDTGPCAA